MNIQEINDVTNRIIELERTISALKKNIIMVINDEIKDREITISETSKGFNIPSLKSYIEGDFNISQIELNNRKEVVEPIPIIKADKNLNIFIMSNLINYLSKEKSVLINNLKSIKINNY